MVLLQISLLSALVYWHVSSIVPTYITLSISIAIVVAISVLAVVAIASFVAIWRSVDFPITIARIVVFGVWVVISVMFVVVCKTVNVAVLS